MNDWINFFDVKVGDIEPIVMRRQGEEMQLAGMPGGSELRTALFLAKDAIVRSRDDPRVLSFRA